MPASILQTYLRLHLLDLGGDDSRLHKLKAAASELAGGFAEAPATALPVFLATLRPDEGVGDAFANVGGAIERQWTTYHGAFQGGTAITLFRAVALQALGEAIDMQRVLGTSVSLLMRNFGPRLELGKDTAAFKLLIDAAETAFEAESDESMTGPVQRTPIVPTVTKATKVDRTALKKRIDAAVGPQNQAGHPGENPNPNWSNSAPQWSYDFSDRLSALLADHLDTVVSKASEMDAKNLGAFGTNLKAVTSQSDSALKRATSLLWWRQALYSESAEQPYRELAPIDFIVHAAIDLSALIPPAYERALESFLMEAILHLLPSQDEITVSELLKVAPKALSGIKDAIEPRAPAGAHAFRNHVERCRCSYRWSTPSSSEMGRLAAT
jgi:hypothetical protein